MCGATFGQVRDHPRARACLSYLGREVKACCEAEGHRLPELLGGFPPDSLGFRTRDGFDQSQRMFIDMYARFSAAKASMLQDLERGRPTEVRMINGYVCQAGDRHGIDTPFNDLVVRIVTGIENGELACSFGNLDLFDPGWFEYPLYEGGRQ